MTVVFTLKLTELSYTRSYYGWVLVSNFYYQNCSIRSRLKYCSTLCSCNLYPAMKHYIVHSQYLRNFHYFEIRLVTGKRTFLRVFWFSTFDFSTQVPTIIFLTPPLCKDDHKLPIDIISCFVLHLKLINQQKTRLTPK